VFIEVDPQHSSRRWQLALRHGGLVRDGSARGHLHSKTMFPGDPARHGIMALDTVETTIFLSVLEMVV